jgi:hypothetical protein
MFLANLFGRLNLYQLILGGSTILMLSLSAMLLVPMHFFFEQVLVICRFSDECNLARCVKTTQLYQIPLMPFVQGKYSIS